MRITITRSMTFDETVLTRNALLRRFLGALLNFLLFFSLNAHSEIYRSVDSQGRVQFSDRPVKQYDRAGYSHTLSDPNTDSTNNARSSKDLESIAKQLKEERLEREDIMNKAQKAQDSRNRKQKKKMAAAKRKKLACKKAREKEDLAFRKRTQRQGLLKMRKALDNYDKKREIRRKKCND